MTEHPNPISDHDIPPPTDASWGHAAVAWLLYFAYERSRATRLTVAGAGVVLVASLLPDLIDKPLSWHLAVLPSGRTLAHSLVTGSLLLAAVVAGFLPSVGADSSSR